MTRAELEQRLLAEGFRRGVFFPNIERRDGQPVVYRADGSPQDDCFTVAERAGRWVVEYLERGNVTAVKDLASEAEACAHVYALLLKAGR